MNSILQSVEKIPLSRIKLQRTNLFDQSNDHGPIKMLTVKPKIIIEKRVSPEKLQQQKTFYGLELSLLKSLNLEGMLP